MGSQHKQFEFDPNSFTYFRQGKLRFFCPLCSHHQSTNTIERVVWKHHAQLLLLTLASTLALWPIFRFDGLLFYLAWWLGFELVYRLRKRDALVCRNCGFDPFLYKRDVKAARAAVKQFWQYKIEEQGVFAGMKLKNYKTKPKSGQNLPQAEKVQSIPTDNAPRADLAAEAKNGAS